MSINNRVCSLLTVSDYKFATSPPGRCNTIVGFSEVDNCSIWCCELRVVDGQHDSSLDEESSSRPIFVGQFAQLTFNSKEDHQILQPPNTGPRVKLCC